MAFLAGQTAVVVEVPAAEPVVGRWRHDHDAAASFGVPAHVTVLFPFLDLAAVDDAVVADLRAVVAGHPAFDVEFRSCGRFPDVLYLAPEPAGPFVRLTDAVVARWPDRPPYGGVHDGHIPHLTVAHGVGEDVLQRVERDVTPRLPVRATVTEAWLLACDGDRWLRRTRLPLGPRAPGRDRSESGHTAG